MNIRFLGAHNSETQNTKCISLLIDDCLVIDAGALTSELSNTEQQKIKTILLTHEHYDHVRDIPGIALNRYQQGTDIKVYATSCVREIIEIHLLNGKLYPRFQELPESKPAVSFNLIRPYEAQWIDGHGILAVPVNHCNETVGYQVADAEGKTMFYTSDTGPGLSKCWKYVSPQLLIADVTLPNKHEESAANMGHLTPSLLHQELEQFRKLKGYLPPIYIVHMEPTLEKEIEQEVAAVSEELNASIKLAYEGMQISI